MCSARWTVTGPRGGQIKELDEVNARMRDMPTTVVSTVVAGDAVEVVAKLTEQSGVPPRSHGSLRNAQARPGQGGWTWSSTC